jgi:DNA-binding phage protein
MNVDGIKFNGVEMKLYKSKDWLYRRYVVQKKTMEEIAKECGVATMTIYRALKDNGLIK